MSDWTTTVNLAIGCVVFLYIGRRALWSRSAYPLPPGPPGIPWVGKVIGVKVDAPWITYAEWARTYGNLVYFRLLGKDMIIVNSEKVAKDLFENRSRNYSDRPSLITNDLCGLDFNSGVIHYGDRWRLHRRIFHQTFRSQKAFRFVPYQHRKACHLLRQLFHSPEDLSDHVFEYTASIILNCAYDYDPASRKDELVEILASILTILVPVLRPDLTIIIDAFPLFLHLPPWFPGMSFKRNLARVRVLVKQYLDRSFEHSLRNIANGSTAPSMVYDALRDMQETGISPHKSWMQAVKGAAGTAFMAGSETSNSFLMTFFFTMMLNPAVQETAQAQIDEVVGKTRLPTIEDRPSLPFIDAVLRETLRHSPVTPLSLPHAAVDDDVYNGFHIPKGAVILANLWSMAHNESKYPNPHAFMPERFLDEDGSLKPSDITNLVFGFGRRMCPGRHLADISLWTVIAKVLAVFKILKPLDENGAEITVEPGFSSGLSIHPRPFEYRIVPRFPDMDAEKLEQLLGTC